MPGQRKQIALRMDDEFRGKFSVKALNPDHPGGIQQSCA
jgi:hypothetical protein